VSHVADGNRDENFLCNVWKKGSALFHVLGGIKMYTEQVVLGREMDIFSSSYCGKRCTMPQRVAGVRNVQCLMQLLRPKTYKSSNSSWNHRCILTRVVAGIRDIEFLT